MDEQVTESQETTSEQVADQTVETTASEATTETAQPSFADSLSEANRSHASAAKFKDVDSLFKSYIEMEGMIGKKGIILPNTEDEADVARYNAEMGVPDSADKYELDAPDQWAQDMKYDQSIMKNIAHAASLTPAQAKIVEQGYLADAKNNATQQAAARKEAIGKAEQESRSKEGEKYEENSLLADRIADNFSDGDEEFAKELKEAMRTTPKLRAQFARIGSQFAEHRIGDFEVTQYAMSSESAQAEMTEMLSSDKVTSPYWSNKDPVAHKAAVDRMDVLEKMVRSRR